jgi:CheY-like chemotaxis protein
VFYPADSGVGPISRGALHAYSRFHVPTLWKICLKPARGLRGGAAHIAGSGVVTVRILLVDDNKTFLAAVRNFLMTLPQVEVVGRAHDGMTALALAEQLAPDLVLLDIVMPGMGGLEVAAALQARDAPPRIIFLSMHDSQSYRTAARELGVHGYVGKGDFVVDLVPLIDSISNDLLATPPANSVDARTQP